MAPEFVEIEIPSDVPANTLVPLANIEPVRPPLKPFCIPMVVVHPAPELVDRETPPALAAAYTFVPAQYTPRTSFEFAKPWMVARVLFQLVPALVETDIPAVAVPAQIIELSPATESTLLLTGNPFCPEVVVFQLLPPSVEIESPASKVPAITTG